MKVKMLRSLGGSWPERYMEGQELDLPDSAAEDLLRRNLAERIGSSPPAKVKEEPKKEEPKKEEAKASGKDNKEK